MPWIYQEQRCREGQEQPGWLKEVRGILCYYGMKLNYLQAVKHCVGPQLVHVLLFSWAEVGALKKLHIQLRYYALCSRIGLLKLRQTWCLCNQEHPVGMQGKMGRHCTITCCDIGEALYLPSNFILMSGVCNAPPTRNDKLKVLPAAGGRSYVGSFLTGKLETLHTLLHRTLRSLHLQYPSLTFSAAIVVTLPRATLKYNVFCLHKAPARTHCNLGLVCSM